MAPAGGSAGANDAPCPAGLLCSDTTVWDDGTQRGPVLNPSGERQRVGAREQEAGFEMPMGGPHINSKNSKVTV